MRNLPAGFAVPGFQLGDRLGESSRGMVFSATDRGGQAVALKIFDPEDKTLFLRRLELYSSIRHANVLPVLDAGEALGVPWIAMPLASEGSLENVMEREGRLSERFLADVIAQAAAGVAALHDREILHGHITPRNVLLDRYDRVYVSEPIGLEVGRVEWSPRSDIQGLGRVMVSALASPRSVSPHLELRSTRPDLSPAMQRILRGTLSSDPADEFESAAELQRAAEAARTTPTFEHRERTMWGELRERRQQQQQQQQQQQRQQQQQQQQQQRQQQQQQQQQQQHQEPPHRSPQEQLAAMPPEETRRAHARLEAPDTAVVGDPFTVRVGLSPRPVPGVTSAGWELPGGEFELTVQLTAGGFALADGDDWLRELEVTYADPYPAAELTLVAEPQEVAVKPRQLQAFYSIDGQPVGMAFRPIAVLRDESQEPDLLDQAAAGWVFTAPTDWPAPDLTVVVLKDKPEVPGSLAWTFQSPHVPVPHKPAHSEIGQAPEAFAARSSRSIGAYEGKSLLYSYVHGVGRRVARHVPDEFWALLAAVSEATGGEPPSILFLTADPYVPWELAVLEQPLDEDAPPFLSAQARVGRWVAGPGGPDLPPPPRAPAKTMAVVFGKYGEVPRWKPLVDAEAEAADLQKSWLAVPVDAEATAVENCLDGIPPADILHFSMHGSYDPNGNQDGLVLVDGTMLDPLVVEGKDFDEPRFVFLNACQVGMSDRVLGDYSGMAAAFLYAGAAGVIAPLWKINDGLARKLALKFYEQVFAGIGPADLLRREREQFKEELKPTSSTSVAYQFYGHPDMKLER